jgi:hypothetical protein
VGQEGSLSITSYVFESVRKCEGLPKQFALWEIESRWIPESLEGDCKGQNSMAWGILYIIEKLLELRCLKWVHKTHLNIWNTNYGQKKSQKSNCQFDSRPLKIKNRLDFLACKWRATYHWKNFKDDYNFASNLISIRGLHAKLWAPKLRESQLWQSRDKMPFGCGPCG